MTSVPTHERDQNWVPQLVSAFQADTNLWLERAPCLSGELSQPTQRKPVRSWKQWNICWCHTSLYSITSSQCNLSIFLPVELRQKNNFKKWVTGPMQCSIWFVSGRRCLLGTCKPNCCQQPISLNYLPSSSSSSALKDCTWNVRRHTLACWLKNFLHNLLNK